jgi:hypothetical protein
MLQGRLIPHAVEYTQLAGYSTCDTLAYSFCLLSNQFLSYTRTLLLGYIFFLLLLLLSASVLHYVLLLRLFAFLGGSTPKNKKTMVEHDYTRNAFKITTMGGKLSYFKCQWGRGDLAKGKLGSQKN